MEALTLHEDAFYEFFAPYRHPQSANNVWGGLGLETFGSDLDLVRKIDPRHLWTLVDGDGNGDMWITPGMRFVNRLCYLVTEKSHQWLAVEFRVPRNASSLTPIGLKRQVMKIERALAQLGEGDSPFVRSA
jgi:hypothetical protein